MGWFWSDSPALQTRPGAGGGVAPPPRCPMHQGTTTGASNTPSCPVGAADSAPPQPPQQPASTLSKLNPLNWMFSDLSQAPAPGQSVRLPTARDPSSIPRGDAPGENWQYPSPQQMYNALLRKGYTDTDATAVESMVAWHNLLNEGAWAEIVEWERRFAGGLRRGWEVSRRGEENADLELRRLEARERANRASLLRKARKGWFKEEEAAEEEEGGRGTGEKKAPGEALLLIAAPKLVRLQGRPGDMTPKAAMMQALGKVWPSYFGAEPPFDRHDWYVSRHVNGRTSEMRYVIDYYSGPPEPNGDPVFFLDVRPAMTATGAAERLIRWGGDVWWRASGGVVRERNEGKDDANRPKAKWYEWKREEKEVEPPSFSETMAKHKK